MIHFKAAHHRATLIPWVGQFKNSICSHPFERGWGGRSYGKEESKLLVCAGFHSAQDLFFDIDA
jgi:hypothetical protein